MVAHDIIKKFNNDSPPFQPLVNCNVHDYHEYQMAWTSVGIKKDALFYEFTTGPDECEVELIPDACLNVLFQCDKDEPEALFSGFFLERKHLRLKPRTSYFGFKPYSNLGLKTAKISFTEFVEGYIDFTEAFPSAKELSARLPGETAFAGKIRLFGEFAKENLIDASYAPTFIDYFTAMICSSKGDVRFGGLKTAVGYSERYCRKVFKDTYGISPKQYSRIMRFQNALKDLIQQPDEALSALALDNGYFDQAHFARDFKEFTSDSPERFQKRYFRASTARERVSA